MKEYQDLGFWITVHQVVFGVANQSNGRWKQVCPHFKGERLSVYKESSLTQQEENSSESNNSRCAVMEGKVLGVGLRLNTKKAYSSALLPMAFKNFTFEGHKRLSWGFLYLTRGDLRKIRDEMDWALGILLGTLPRWSPGQDLGGISECEADECNPLNHTLILRCWAGPEAA